MANYDGSITLETKVDTKGIKNSTGDIKSAADKAGQAFKNLGGTLAKALAEGDTKTAQLANSFQKATAEVEKQSAKVDELKTHLAQLKSGEITVNSAGTAKLQADFDRASASVEKTKAEINELYMQLDNLQSKAFRAPDSGEVVLTGKEQAEFDKINAKLNELEPKLEQDRKKAQELGKELQNAAGAATQAEISKTSTKLSDAERKLGDLSAKAEIAGQKLESGMNKNAQSASAVSSGFGKMGTKLAQLAKGALIFSAITKGFTAIRQSVGAALMSNEGFRQSLNRLQAAFWTAFAPIYNYVLPALQTLINWITSAITSVLKLFAALTGKSYSAMVDSGKMLQKQTAAYKKSSSSSGGGTGKSAEEKAIEDQIKALQKKNKELRKQQKAAEKERKKQEAANKKSLAGFDELNILSEQKNEDDEDAYDIQIEKNDEIIDQLQEQLALLQEQKLTGGSSGADGGDMGGAFEDLKNFDIGPISEKLQELMGIAAAALVAIGLILLFTGNIGWGIGFIITGAFLLAVSIANETEYDPTANPKEKLNEFLQILGGMLAAIGIIFIFFGQIPLGIGFIIAGIAAFGVSSAQLSESEITTKIQAFLQENESLIVGVSYALLILGIILLFTPVNYPIALGLIAAGVIGLASEIAINEGDMKTKIETFFNDNRDLIVGVSIALLVLGVVLICTGVALPLGIGLIAVGAAGLAAEAVLNWEYIKTCVQTFFQENHALIAGVSLALLVLGVVLICTGVALPLGIGLIAVGAAGLVTVVALNWETIKTNVSNTITSIGNWCKTWGLLVLGIILMVTGVGIPLGIALIKKGGANLAEAQDPAWTAIVDKVKEVWGNVQKYWKEHIAKYFTAKWWGDLAKGAINGFVKWIINGLNALIRKINSFGFDLPEVLGGGHIGFNISEIKVPALARGTVVPQNREFLALLGDNKNEPEIVSPLSTMEQAVENVLARQGYFGSNQTIILELDGREVGRTFGQAIQNEARRTGSSFVKPKIVFG